MCMKSVSLLIQIDAVKTLAMKPISEHKSKKKLFQLKLNKKNCINVKENCYSIFVILDMNSFFELSRRNGDLMTKRRSMLMTTIVEIVKKPNNPPPVP